MTFTLRGIHVMVVEAKACSPFTTHLKPPLTFRSLKTLSLEILMESPKRYQNLNGLAYMKVTEMHLKSKMWRINCEIASSGSNIHLPQHRPTNPSKYLLTNWQLTTITVKWTCYDETRLTRLSLNADAYYSINVVGIGVTSSITWDWLFWATKNPTSLSTDYSTYLVSHTSKL